MSIEIFRQNCHFCSAKILTHTELSNFLMNYFGNLAVFFHFEQMFCLSKDIAAYLLLPYNIRTQGGQLLHNIVQIHVAV